MKMTMQESARGYQTANEHIGVLEKISFFLGGLGEAPVSSIMSSFLLIFYTDVVKLNVAAVGTLFLIARVFDSVNDIFIGFIIDHLPKTKWGRFRPWLAIFGVLASINFCMLWLGPLMATSGKLIIAYVTYLLMGVTFSGMDVTLGSLLPCMTYKDKERNSLSIVKSIAMMIGNGIPVIIMVPLLAKFPTPAQGYQTIMIIVSIIVLACVTICAAGVKERVLPVKREKYPISITFKILFKTKPVTISFLAMFFMMAGMQIRGGAVMYYLKYNVGNGNLMSIFSAGTLVAMLLGIVIFPGLANKFEKRSILIVCLFVTAIGFLATLIIPVQNIPLVILTNAFACLGEGGFSAILMSLQADLVDYVEWKHEYRAEGAVISLNAFVMKLGIALGGAVPAYVLALCGYNADVNIQATKTLSGILATMSVLPFIFVCVGIFTFSFLKLSRKDVAQVNSELNKRKEAAGNPVA